MNARHEIDRASLPPGHPCVWMSAGLLAYHLCDREYDCEDCPLDAALRRAGRGQHSRRTGHAGSGPAGSHGRWEFPPDRRYGTGHGWVQQRPRGRVRLGLDAFAASLLAPAQGVIFPAAGRQLRAGENLCWVRTGASLVPVRTLLAGRLCRRNRRVRLAPSLLESEPYGNGWLAEVEPASANLPDALLDAEAARARALAGTRLIATALAEAASREGRAVGPTLQDGGEPAADPRRLLGEARWLNLVQRLLV